MILLFCNLSQHARFYDKSYFNLNVALMFLSQQLTFIHSGHTHIPITFFYNALFDVVTEEIFSCQWNVIPLSCASIQQVYIYKFECIDIKTRTKLQHYMPILYVCDFDHAVSPTQSHIHFERWDATIHFRLLAISDEIRASVAFSVCVFFLGSMLNLK